MSTERFKRLGASLARALMAVGDVRTPAHRIQFMGGEYPDGEIGQGGMNEEALSRFLANWLEKKSGNWRTRTIDD